MNAESTHADDVDEPAGDEEDAVESEAVDEDPPEADDERRASGGHTGKIIAGLALLAVGVGVASLVLASGPGPRSALMKSPVGRVVTGKKSRATTLSRMASVGAWFVNLLAIEPVREVVGHWLRDLAKKMQLLASDAPSKAVVKKSSLRTRGARSKKSHAMAHRPRRDANGAGHVSHRAPRTAS